VLVAAVGAFAYFFPRDAAATKPSANTEVTAEGDDSIAAGRDVNIDKSRTIDKHDYDKDREREAEAYLSTARETCASLADKIVPLNADSSFNLSNPGEFMAQAVEPTQVAAEEYGEEVYGDINTRLQLIRTDFDPIRTALIGNNFGKKLDGTGRARFDTDKKKWLEDTRNLCAYLRGIKKRGA